MITVSLPLYLLVIANAALIVAAAFAVMRVERSLREPQEFWSSPTGRAMRDHGPGGKLEQQALIGQIEALHSAVTQLKERAALPTLSDRVVDLSLGRAVRMVKQGAAVEELITDCGLNRGEAELLHRLHGSECPPQRTAVNHD